MSQPIIEVEGLSKRYQLGAIGATSLRETFERWWRPKQVGLTKTGKGEFWALRDVSFSIQPGEVVGIIGRNGAGKSTLLKILSRITEPTTGRVILRGRVASLLEVGTGFHPDLTGRENTYLNGAILGMTRAEVRRKFDEIVNFAEVEQFIDTPVKRYSSGMYVRLAFAVAAHLEPEILIVDEVLAVGDSQFQQKCLGKMNQVANQDGRTVLFVSHSMEAIDKLTSRCIYLKKGTIAQVGTTASVVATYLSDAEPLGSTIASHRVSSIPQTAELLEVWAENSAGARTSAFRQGEHFRLCLRFNTSINKPMDAALVIENSRQQALFTTHLTDTTNAITTAGVHSIGVELTEPKLRRGNYLVSIALFSTDKLLYYDVVHHFPLFEIVGTSDPAIPDDIRWGDMYFPMRWDRLTRP